MIRPTHYRYLFFIALIVASIGLLVDLGLPPSPDTIPHKDKAVHFGMFVVITWFGLQGYASHIKRIIVGLALYGIATELAQGLTSYRSASVADWLFDVIGIGVAFWLWQRQQRGNTQQ